MPRTKSWRAYRFVILGGARVGKSALAIQFVLDRFVDDFGPVIEESYRKGCMIDGEVTGLEVIDTVGVQEEFNMVMMNQYMGVAKGFLLVYSITSRKSFEEIVTAYQQILRFKAKGSFAAILVANKCDLEHEREVGMQEGRDLARHLGCIFIETSAKNRIGVDEAFISLAREVRKREPGARARYDKPGGSDARSGGCRGRCVII